MRKILLAGVCLFLINGAGVLFAQNKTLGVGVSAPNPNAALHVESPTGNQGFIMPRLTTVQRNGMSALLTASDNGVMLYDTDLSTIFVWDGFTWKTTSEVAGGPSLVYPYVDTISTSPGADVSLFKLLYTGTTTENVGVAGFENQNPQNAKDAMTVTTNGLGSAGRFTVNNTQSKKPVLWVETNSDSALSAPIYSLNTGTGDVAASFRLSNPQNGFPALFAESFGTGRTATFRKMGTTGSQPAVFIDSRGGHGVWADHKSPTGYAAIIQTIDTTNAEAGMLVETIGTGPSVWALKSADAVSGDALKAENWLPTGGAALFVQTHDANPTATVTATTAGTGSAGFFEQTNTTTWTPALMALSAGQGAAFSATSTVASVNANAAEFVVKNTSNPRNAVMAATEGMGSAGSFTNNNPENGAPAIIAKTNGSGAAIVAENNGSTDGFAGSFHNASTTNTYPAIQASTEGSGPGVRVMQTTGSGAGMDILMQNAASDAQGFVVDQGGLGAGGTFVINNATNGAPALNAFTSGTGAAVEAVTSSGFTAILARHDGAGNGNAGIFDITSPSNAYPALQVNTAGTGFAVNARHTGSSGDAIYGEHAGGTGSAGNFRISNSLNGAAALNAATNAAGGSALGLANDANGIAFSVWNGGLQITTNVVTTTSITTRASAYQITGGGTTFTLDFAPRDGEVFMIYNETGTVIAVAGVTMQNGEGKTFIVFPGGAIRGF